MGALYGTAAELLPRAGAGAGAPFGAALYAGAHAIAVPAFGLAPPVTRNPVPAEAGEFGAHLVYGLVTDAVRRGVRRLL